MSNKSLRYFFYVTSSSTTMKLRLCHSLVQWVMLFGFLAYASCSSPRYAITKAYKQLSPAHKQLADTLLLTALDHEALYTLADTLKPMSSIKMYKLPLLSTNPIQKDSAYHIVNQLQHIANTLSVAGYQFVVQPFNRGDSIYKYVELCVIRKTKMQYLIEQQQTFYQSLGIASKAKPETVLAITEYEQKYNRWRSYGYLFGYPSYAVDFFVQAGKSQDSTKQFVTRDFFAIPVYAAPTGHFTYAIPKGYVTTSVDSALYNKAIITLHTYTKLRKKYTTNGNIKAITILKKLN